MLEHANSKRHFALAIIFVIVVTCVPSMDANAQSWAPNENETVVYPTPANWNADIRWKARLAVYLGPNCKHVLVAEVDSTVREGLPDASTFEEYPAAFYTRLPAGLATQCATSGVVPEAMGPFAPRGKFDAVRKEHCDPKNFVPPLDRVKTSCRVAADMRDVRWLVILDKTFTPIAFVKGDAAVAEVLPSVSASEVARDASGPACTISCPPGKVAREVTIAGRRYCVCM